MSRHRYFRNLNAEEYLDEELGEYDDDRYYEEDLEEEQEEEASQIQPQNQLQPDQDVNQPSNSVIDKNILDDIVIQFRHLLSDETITTSQVDLALQEADYEWEIALSSLKSHQTVAAEQAVPSPIAELLSDDQPQFVIPMPSASGPSPDYHSFVADQGTALTTSIKIGAYQLGAETQPFQFDQPSPDDIVYAKQARITKRTTPALRLPKPSQQRRPTRSLETEPPATKTPESKTDSKPASKSTESGTPVSRRTRSQKAINDAPKDCRQRVKKVDLSARIASSAASIAVVVAGHVDAGKSTLIGHLLQQLSPPTRRGLSNLAWATDEDSVERDRGVTIDIAPRLLMRPGNPPRAIMLIDAPGHRDFVPAMILGAAQSSCALLVVDASHGEFEAGFAENGQTREHAIVLKAFDVSTLVVVVNKMDVVDYSRKRYDQVRGLVSDFLRSNGWKAGRAVRFIPMSGREGINLTSAPPPKHPMNEWFKGKTLIEELDSLPCAPSSHVQEVSRKATRFVVTDFFKSTSLGGQAAVTGRLLTGSIAAKDKLCIAPGKTQCTVKSVALGDGTRIPVAIAGLDAQPVSLGIMDMPDGAVIAAGSVLCDPVAVLPAVMWFRARVLVTGADVIVMQGARGVLHIGGAAEASFVSKLCEYTGGKKGKGGKKKVPRRLVKGETAIIEIQCERAVALDEAGNMKTLGRFAFRQEGRTTAVGVVVDVLETANADDGEG